MTEEPELPLAGLDAERPLPPELLVRLEAALLAAVAGGLPVPADAWELHQPSGTHTESLDAPRPLPEPLRARLESVLLAGAAASPPTAVPASEAATASPPAPVSLEGRRRKVVAWWPAVAAVLVLVLAMAGLAGISGDGGSGTVEVANPPTTTTIEAPASLPSEAGVSSEAAPSASSAAGSSPTGPAATAPTRGASPVRPSPGTPPPAPPSRGTDPGSTGGPALSGPAAPPGGGGGTGGGTGTGGGPGGATQPAPAQRAPGPTPPFYESAEPAGDGASPPAVTSDPDAASPSPAPSAGAGDQGGAAPNQSRESVSPTAPALRVGVVRGDAAQEAGFRAYVDRLNQSGGVRGYSIRLVNVGPGSPAADAIATVNLGTLPVAGPGGAPAWVTGPLLETLTATEDLLRGGGSVFSFSSAPERQGHLAADALFPSEAAAGTKAVIYTATAGPLRDVVPAAMRAVLERRGVAVKVVPFDPGHQPARFEQADAALLSLDPAAAKVWLAEARSARHQPPAGVAGIYSLADDSLLADLPEGARVVSPYVAPGGDEGQAIRSGAGGTSAPVLHGWATAKSMAAAIWRTGADTPAELQAALEGLAGWSSGLAPRYETRPGTRSRTPEGVLFRVQFQAFVADGGFRRDPY